MKDKDSIFGAEPERLRDLIRAGMDVDDEDDKEKPAVNDKVGKIMERPGTRIGSYKLLKVLGEGGMGMVYLAEQEQFIRRRVALKIIKPGMDSKRVLARFESERQALALLDHPNIAQVHDAGTSESGRPYFVMEFVKGIPITEFCDQHSLSIEQRLRLFQQVCSALQHAHHKGIIHRDLKPSNILVTSEDDQIIPKIIDFGVAKALTHPLTDRTLITEQDQLLGTPEYMSPEQVEQVSDDIDTRSDIYSLGVLLYELLTGVLPFDSKTLRTGGIEHIRKVIRETDPKTPSTRLTKLGDEAKKVADSRRTEVAVLARCLHSELEWIPLKAMRKERSERYRSASELSDDIENYLNGNPLIAGPPSTAYRLRKFVRRHKALVTGAAAVLLVLLAGIVVSTIFGMEANRQKLIAVSERDKARQAERLEASARVEAVEAEKVAQEQRDRAEQQAEEYRRSLYVRNINLADKYYLENNTQAMHKYLADCPDDLRQWEWDYLWRTSDKSLMTLKGHEGWVRSAVFSPDGGRIASGSNDNTIKLWEAESGKELLTLKGHEAVVRSVMFSPDPDGKWIVSGSNDGTIRIWDAITGEVLRTLEGHTGPVTSVAFSPDGRRIASGGGAGDRTIKVWDVESGKVLKTLTGHTGPVTSVAFSPDGRRIASGGGAGDRTIKVWDAVKGGEPIMTLENHEGPITSLAFSPDGRRIASGSLYGDTTIKVWDAVNGGEPIITLEGHEAPVVSVMFSPDGERIVSGSRDTTIKVWDTETGGELLTLMGHTGEVNSIAFSPDGERIVSGSADSTVRVWDAVKGGKPIMILNGHKDWVDWVTFSPDGKKILSGSNDKTLKLWDIESASELMTLWGHQHYVHSVAFSPDGKRIVSGSQDRTLKLWDAETGDELFTLEGHEGPVYAVAFGPDGMRIASACYDNTLKVWDAKNGDELMTLEAPHQFYYVAFSPDSKRIVSSGVNIIEVWDAINGGEPIKTLTGHEGMVEPVVFSPDGSRIVSGGYRDNKLKVWDANSGDELMTLQGHNGSVLSIVFSPDGSRIVSGSLDGTVRVWDATTGAELVALRAESGVLGVAFSPDGKTIAAGRQDDNAVILWDSVLSDSEYEARKIGIVATKLVDELYEEPQYYKQVLTQLNTDSTLDEQTRKIALQVANSRLYEDDVKDAEEIIAQLYQKHGYYYDVMNELQADKTIDESILDYALKIANYHKRQEANRLDNESWAVVSSPNKSIEEYQTALEKAKKANTSEPNNWSHLNTLGVAQYRIGDYEEALETFRRSDKIHIELNQSSSPFNLAGIAMSQYKLDRDEDAKATLGQLRELCKDDLYSGNLQVQAALVEAEKLIAGE